MKGTNEFVLTGVVIERKPLRYTPAGVPVSEATIAHESEQVEANLPRVVLCEVRVLAVGENARWLDAAKLGSTLKLQGFMAAKSQRQKSLVLHIQLIEFLEGN